MPLNGSVAAVSVGMVDGRALCDLDYSEDSKAEVDANVVMTGDGGLVEVQATAERTPLSRASLDELLGLAEMGIVAPAPGSGAGRRTMSAGAYVIFATGNKHKLREMRELLPGRRAGSTARGRGPAARGRRRLRRDRAREGACGAPRHRSRPAFADDSGIGAVALGGRPGINSARYGGEGATDEENLEKLLREVGAAATTAGRLLHRVRSRSSTTTALSGSSKAAARGSLIEEPRGEGGLRLRPRLRSRRDRSR